MSDPVEDCLPFHLGVYTQKILPIWFEALSGHVQPLRDLIDSADHFSMWPHIDCSRFISADDYEHFFVKRFNAIHVPWPDSYPIFFEQYPYKKPTRSVDLWDILRPIVDALEGASDPLHVPYQDVLHHCLVFTWCCELPPDEREMIMRSGQSMVTSTHGSTLMGIEDLAYWYDYLRYDEVQRTLWHPFLHRRSLTEYVLEQNMVPSLRQLQDTQIAHFRKRGHGGLITHAELKTILEQDRDDTQRLFPTIIDRCVSDASEREVPFDLRLVQTDDWIVSMVDSYGEIEWNRLEPQLLPKEEENLRLVYDELEKTYPYLMALFREKAYHQLRSVIHSVKQRMQFAVDHDMDLLFICD